MARKGLSAGRFSAGCLRTRILDAVRPPQFKAPSHSPDGVLAESRLFCDLVIPQAIDKQQQAAQAGDELRIGLAMLDTPLFKKRTLTGDALL